MSDEMLGTYLAKTPGLSQISYYVNQFADRSLRDKVAAIVGGAHTALMRKDYWGAVELVLQAASAAGLDSENYKQLKDRYDGLDADISNINMPIQRGFFVPLAYLFSEQQFPDADGRVLIVFKGYCATSRKIGFESEIEHAEYSFINDEITLNLYEKSMGNPTKASEATGHKSEDISERYLGAWYRLVANSWRYVKISYEKTLFELEGMLDYWPLFKNYIEESTKKIESHYNTFLEGSPLELFVAQWDRKEYSEKIPAEFFVNLRLQKIQPRRDQSGKKSEFGRLPFTNDDIYNIRGLATDAREPQQDLLRSLSYTERLVNYLLYGIWSVTTSRDKKELHATRPKDTDARLFLTNFCEVIQIIRYCTYAHGSNLTHSEFHYLNKLRSVCFKTALLGQSFVMQLVKWVLSQDPHAASRSSKRRSSTYSWVPTTPPSRTPVATTQEPLKIEAKTKPKPLPEKKTIKKPSVPKKSPKVDLGTGPKKKGGK